MKRSSTTSTVCHSTRRGGISCCGDAGSGPVEHELDRGGDGVREQQLLQGPVEMSVERAPPALCQARSQRSPLAPLAMTVRPCARSRLRGFDDGERYSSANRKQSLKGQRYFAPLRSHTHDGELDAISEAVIPCLVEHSDVCRVEGHDVGVARRTRPDHSLRPPVKCLDVVAPPAAIHDLDQQQHRRI
eukprot:COSAG01_NODE_19274_length_1020_cov_1.021716_1_plen_188_part_00